MDAGLHRTAINKKLSVDLGEKYDKASGSIYEKLCSSTKQAHKHALRLEKHNARCTAPYLENPSTNVHRLVAVLEKLAGLTIVDKPPTSL